MRKGTVKSFSRRSGLGCIESNGIEVVVSRKALKGCTYLRPGAEVTLSIELDNSEPVAVNVSLIKREKHGHYC